MMKADTKVDRNLWNADGKYARSLKPSRNASEQKARNMAGS
jgi:hypothetical protein